MADIHWIVSKWLTLRKQNKRKFRSHGWKIEEIL